MASSDAPGEQPTASDAGPRSPAAAATAGDETRDEPNMITQDEPAAPAADPEPEAGDAPSSPESGEASSPEPSKDGSETGPSGDAPPLPNEAPPLPGGPPPGETPQDDGWDFHWDATNQAYFFHNRFTGATTWENPRAASSSSSSAATPAAPGAPGTSTSAALSAPPPLPDSRPAAGGYNPAIHGDYDPNAWYAQGAAEDGDDGTSASAAAAYLDHTGQVAASFNRFTGQFQRADEGPDRHTDEAKSRRQMNAFFDVDAAANAHDGRSLKAERSGKKISKSELKHFKEKRKARKEEKRRAWLRD